MGKGNPSGLCGAVLGDGSMRAILLMGGYGTRLQPLTLRTPKCLLPVGGKPLLVHLLELLGSSGIRDVVISLNATQTKAQEYLGDGRRWGVSLRYVYEETKSNADKLGSVGAIGYVTDRVGVEDVQLVVAGDNFVRQIDFNEMVGFHKKRGATVTMALYELEEPHLIEHYSAALFDEKGRIIRFQEKPRMEEAVSNLAGTGFYLIQDSFLERSLPDYLEACRREGVRPDRIGDLWERFVDEVPIYGYVFRGTWLDIGNLEMYLRANEVVFESAMEKVDSPVPSSVELRGKGVRIGADVELGRDVVVSGPVLIEEGCRVAEGARVGPHVRLGRGSEVGEDTELRDSVIFERVRIGDGSRIEGSAIDGRCRLGEDCVVEGYSILGFDAVLGDGVMVTPGSRVWPFATIEKGASVSGDGVASLSRDLEERLSASRFWEN